MLSTSERFTPDNVCNVLLKFGLISESQRKEIMAKKDRLTSKLSRYGP